MTDQTTAYFDDLVERAAQATSIARIAAASARPNECHVNCERFVEDESGFQIVRGWLVIGGHFFMPHSVLRERCSGRFIDITPDPTGSDGIPFVEHVGSEEEFQLQRRGRDGGWLHPLPADSPPSEFESMPEAPADRHGG